MKKYIFSIILSLIAGLLFFLFSFDKTLFAYLLGIPVAIIFLIPAVILRLKSVGTSGIASYAHLIIWPLWFAITQIYSKFAYENLAEGDSFLYTNIVLANQIISSILVIAPVILLLSILLMKRN